MTRPGSPAIVCPNCGKLVNADEKKCPYCDTRNPGAFGGARSLSGLFGERLDMVHFIPIWCGVLYLLSLALDPRSAFSASAGFLSILSPGVQALGTLGMTFRGAPWWTVLTAIYLHGGLLHIFFNVMWIRQLGPHVEEAFGPARFFIIFTLSGIAGFVLSNALHGSPTIGASGAVFGLLAAMIVYGRSVGGHFGDMMSRQLWQWAIVLFVLGFMLRGVNNWAHLGGFGAGWLTASVMVRQGVQRERRGVVIFALTLVACTLLAFLIVGIRVTRLILS